MGIPFCFNKREMPRLLSKTEPKKITPEEKTRKQTYREINEVYSFKKLHNDGKLPLLPKLASETKNGFYRTPSGKKIFSYDGKCYEGTRMMSAWCYYNFATNLRKRKMNGDQYDFWRNKMYQEGKERFLYD